MGKIQVGVINWDAALPKDTYMGYFVTRALSPSTYRDRVPFYTDIIDDEHVSFHARTDEEFTCELQYAANAGIDYFAYVWYNDEPFNAKQFITEENEVIVGGAWEIAFARKMHARNPLRNKVKMCAVLCGADLLDTTLSQLAVEMQQPYYQKMENQPLVYVYGGYRPETISRLRAFCREKGTVDPYVVFMNHTKPPREGDDYSAAQGVSDYSCVVNDVPSFDKVTARMLHLNEERLAYNMPCIPLFTTGWNPMPRMDHEVPWIKYRSKQYAPAPTEAEMLDSAKQLAAWYTANKVSMTGHILTFAWNEFEEGGYLCPTRGQNGQPNTELLDAFAKCVAYWKTTL